MPAKSLGRQTQRGRNPVTRSVVAEASWVRRVLRTPPKNSEPDGRRPPHFIPAQAGIQRGTRQTQVVPGRTGIQRGVARGSLSVQDPSELSFTRHTSARYRWTGEATAPARGANRAMTGAVLSECFPEGRRSGDVGGAGSSRAVANRTRPGRNGAAMIRISNIRTKPPPKGELNTPQITTSQSITKISAISSPDDNTHPKNHTNHTHISSDTQN